MDKQSDVAYRKSYKYQVEVEQTKNEQAGVRAEEKGEQPKGVVDRFGK